MMEDFDCDYYDVDDFSSGGDDSDDFDSSSPQEQLTFLNKVKDQETDLSRCAAVDSLDFDSEDDGDYSPFVSLSQKAIKRELRVLGCAISSHEGRLLQKPFFKSS